MGDNKIIGILNDFSKAIDEMAKSLIQKKEDKNNIFNNFLSTGGKIAEELKNGIKNIKKDTEKILKNQETLINISKEKKSETNLFEGTSEKKSKIKDGVSTVVLIAAGVLAIGLAFKLIGEVDFLSVIALSITLPMVAMAFEKISQMKSLNPAEMKNIFFVTVTMATSIAVASWIMSTIIPISITQGLTSILISGTFLAISFGMKKILEETKDIKASDISSLPKVLATFAAAITLSSWVLKGIMPMSFGQGITAILIAGTFLAVSYGMKKIIDATKDIEAKDVANLPKILVSFALSIMLSSWIMKAIIPISFGQGVTAILIAGTFLAISYGMEKIVKATKNIEAKDVAELPLILVAFAASIMLSSFMFFAIVPMTFEQGLTAIAIAATLAIMSASLPLLALAVKYTTIKDAFLMTAILPLLALAITISSHILSKVKVIDGSILLNIAEQSVAIAISALAIGGAAWVLAKIGIGTLLEGSVAILGLALVIAGTSQLLRLGNYEDGNYPSLDWAEGVGLSLLAFGISAAGLGFIAMTGIGTAALIAGGVAILGLGVIVATTSHILAKGKYLKNAYPNIEWAKGVGESLSAFGSILNNMGLKGIVLNLIGKALGTGPVDIAKQIVEVSDSFSGKNFTNYPSMVWSESVSKSLMSFASMSAELGLGGITLNLVGKLLGTGPVDIAKQIVDVNDKFSGKDFSNYPPVEWAKSVTTLMSQFISMSSDRNFADFISDKITGGVESIANQIVKVAAILNTGVYGGKIPDGYMKSMSDNIKEYVGILEYLQGKNVNAFSFIDTLSVTYGLAKLSEGYDKLANSVKSLGNSLKSLDVEKLTALNRLTGGIVMMSLMDSNQFEKMMDALEAKAGIFVKVIEELEEETQRKNLGTIGSVKTGSEKGNSVDQQILAELVGINNKMTTVAASCTAFVNYIDELRSANSIRTKKHY